MRKIEHCPACDERDAKVVAQLDEDSRLRFLKYSDIKYRGLITPWLQEISPRVVRCGRCGHCWYKTQPSEHQLSLMYAAARQLHPEIPIDRFPSALAVREVKKLRSLVHRRKPSFLDYGSGYGRWARAAVNEGFEVYAFEPSQHRGAEDDAPFVLIHNVNELNGKTFDVVNLEQVLEHVLDPHALLIEIKNVCHAESIIRVSVPNILRCDEGKEIWRDWPFDGHRSHIMAPFEHLHGFTPLSLTKLVARSRYKSIPFTDLLRYYPTSVPRRAIGRFFEQVGQTKLILHQDGV